MKNTKQIFPIIFVVFLAIGLFFVVKANDRETERLAESSKIASEQAKTTINTEDTTLIPTKSSNSNTESKGTSLKFTKKTFSIKQKSKKTDYPITAVITAKRVVKYFFDDLKTSFELNDKINSYYKEINNDKTFSKNTIFLTIVSFDNSNSKTDVSAVKYIGNEINIDITETAAKKPDKKKCQKMFVVNVADKDCNAKAMQKINVNVIKK